MAGTDTAEARNSFSVTDISSVPHRGRSETAATAQQADNEFVSGYEKIEPHPRRVFALMALLVVLGLTAVVLGHLHRRHRQAGGPSITVDGRRYYALGTSHVDYAVIDSRSPTSLTLWGEVNNLPGWCGTTPVVRAHTTATGTEVRVRLTGYGPPVHGNACDASGRSPQPTTVTLDRPLGARTVREVSSGRRIRVGDASHVSALTSPPTGYRASPWNWSPVNNDFTRIYVNGVDDPESGPEQIRYVVYATRPIWLLEDTRLLERTTVGSAPAVVYRQSVGPSIEWSPDGKHVVVIQASSRSVSVRQLLATARLVQ